MSQFTTSIPINMSEVLSRLPKGAFVHPTRALRLSADGSRVELQWEHDHWRTPYTRPVEVSVAQLSGEEPMPDIVKIVKPIPVDIPPPIAEPVRVQSAAVVGKAKRGVKAIQ